MTRTLSMLPLLLFVEQFQFGLPRREGATGFDHDDRHDREKDQDDQDRRSLTRATMC